ncbi:MAG: hypothetical protein KatS3mg051_1448 [Anaerolineae bacterium]|nr:MAG: hypothetical protein KatS3mg051_1448 [Anaerolineae bacterium]
MASWTDHPYHYRGHLFLLKPAPIFKARLNLASPSYPAHRLPYDTVTLGSYTDIREGMTVLLGTSEGADDLGRGRVRLSTSGVATVTDIYVGQFSRGTRDGEFDLQDDAYITVLDDYRVWAVLPRITSDGTVYKDYNAPYSWCEPQPPVANAGVGYAGLIDPDTGLIAVDFDGSASFAVASGATITGYAWDFADGTPASAITAQVNGVTFPPGFRWVRLTVTDSNGQSHTAVVPVLAIDPDDPEEGYVQDFQVIEQRCTREGQEIVFRVFEDIPLTDFPDGTLVMYWEDEYYAGQQGSLAGPAGREHVKFIGWLDSEPAEIEATEHDTRRQVELRCVDVAGRLRQLPGFPMTIERANTPTQWTQLKGLNIDRYVWFVLRWHSTALSLADFTWSGTGDTYAIPTLGSDGQSLWEQADGRTQAIAHLLTCDRWGRLAMRPDPQLQDSDDRTTTVQAALTADDFVSLTYTRQRFPRVHWLWGEAIQASTAQATDATITPLFCVAPGKAPGQGVSEATQGEQVVVSQTELNAREGHRYAVRHNPEETYFEVVLAHAGDVGIDPARLEWVTLTLPATIAAQRGLAFTDERFLPLEMTIEHDHEAATKRVTLVLERERVGTPAATHVPPTGEFEDWEDFYPEDYGITEPEVGEFWLLAGADSIAAFCTDSYLYRTADFMELSPVWERVYLNVVGQILLFVVDAFSPGYVGGGSQINGWFATTQGIYRITDIFGASPGLTLCYTFGYTLNPSGEDVLQSVAGDASFGVQNHVVFIIPQYDHTYGPAKALYTRDGLNFTAVNLPGGTSGSMTLCKPGLYVSSKTPGLVYAAAPGDADGRLAKFFISTNYGATWQESTFDGPRHPKPNNLLYNGSRALHVPYDGNDDERDIIYSRDDGGGLTLYRRTGGSEADITPPLWGKACLTRWGCVTAPLDRTRLAFVGMESWNGKLYLSQNGGDSWVEQEAVRWNVSQVAIAGDNPNILYAWGSNWDLVLGFRPRIWYYDGTQWIDKRGNIESLGSGNRRLIGICGGPTT